MLDFQVWDVFTDRRFSGNPLAIVTGAQDLTTAQMLALARQFNLSETIFVMPPRDPANTARVRIFFPTAEIPFAGHPTIGCAIYLATQGEAGDFDKTIRLEEEAGLVPVTVSRRNGTLRAEFQAPVLPFATAQATVPETTLLADAIGLYPSQLGPDLPGVFEGGPRFLYIPVKDLAALAKSRVFEPQWSDALDQAQVDSAYLYCHDADGQIRARMYSPTAGIPEDPATGSAAAILSAQLAANGHIPQGETLFAIQQGVEMGRPSQIGLRVRSDNDQITSVYVSGSAVPVSQGQTRLPDAER